MARGESVLAPLVRKIIRRPAPVLLGDALVAGIIWIVLDAIVKAVLQGKVYGMVNSIRVDGPDPESLGVYLVPAAAADIVGKICAVVALGLLTVGVAKLHAELTAANRTE